jgi:hypothetical protein
LHFILHTPYGGNQGRPREVGEQPPISIKTKKSKQFFKEGIDCSARFGYTHLCANSEESGGSAIDGLHGIAPMFAASSKACRKDLCAMRHAPCAMRHAPCAMRHAPCAMRHAPCAMRHAPCAMRYAEFALSFLTFAPPNVRLQTSELASECSSAHQRLPPQKGVEEAGIQYLSKGEGYEGPRNLPRHRDLFHFGQSWCHVWDFTL